MDDFLSIVVPVRDAEAVIGEQVHYLLDVLPDLTSRFEIVVIDDASNDHTAEIIGDLARQYPQIRLIVQPVQRGLVAAAKAGLAAATGKTIFVQEDMQPLSANDLRRLWSLRHEESVVVARTQGTASGLSPQLIERLSTWGQTLRRSRKRLASGGIQMIRRDGAQSLVVSNVSQDVVFETTQSVGGRRSNAERGNEAQSTGS